MNHLSTKYHLPGFLLALLTLGGAISISFLNPLHAESESKSGGGSLSLADATARAIEKNPALAAFGADRRAAEARIITAMMRPNPELETEIEDVLGSGEYQDFQSAAYNVGLSQLLELGGKRRLRENIARADVEVEDLRYESAVREVMLETAKRFVAVLTSQSAEENASQVVAIAEDTAKAVGGLQEGGRGSAVDVKRSELGLKQAQLQLGNRQRESILARRQLAAMWGESDPSFDRVTGKLTSPRKNLPSLEELRAGLEEHPAVAMAKAGKMSAQDSLALERRKVTPDLNVGLAYRRDTTIDDNAVVLKFSLPLPLWSQNEGGIAEAEAAIDQNEAIVTQTLTRLDLALSEAWAQLENAHAEYQIVSGEMLPAAEELHQTLLEGFGLGRTSYLELLEARRSLTEIRSERIDALAKYHTARVEIETLTGTNSN
ncbi:MAG: TolC family protein [Verrucomicrobiae bacterium]|nr:TolC family protein [Verrucomicrobiae bacterium]